MTPIFLALFSLVVLALVMSVFTMLSGSCIDQYLEVDRAGKAVFFAVVGVVFSAVIFAAGFSAHWVIVEWV